MYMYVYNVCFVLIDSLCCSLSRGPNSKMRCFGVYAQWALIGALRIFDSSFAIRQRMCATRMSAWSWQWRLEVFVARWLHS